MEVHNLIEIDDGSNPPVYLWTGFGTQTWNGNSYAGTGKVLRISPIESRSGIPDRRVTITISTIPVDLRSRFLQDFGPANLVIRWGILSANGNLQLLTPIYKGQLSDPTMEDGTLTIEVETLRGDVDRGVPVFWSHEDQQRRSTGDLGMEHMRSLAREGIEAAWPP